MVARRESPVAGEESPASHGPSRIGWSGRLRRCSCRAAARRPQFTVAGGVESRRYERSALNRLHGRQRGRRHAAVKTSSPCCAPGRYLVLLSSPAFSACRFAAAAYWYLYLVAELQKWVFKPAYLPKALGFHGEPIWWPLPVVGLAGVLVGLAIRFLPGPGGHSPADGFDMQRAALPLELPGVALAALAGLALGAVIGPEAPLIAARRRPGRPRWSRCAKRDAARSRPSRWSGRLAASRRSAPCSARRSPRAFLLMEASGLGGPMLGLVLVPGLLAAGVGALIFIGFDS